MSDADKRQEGGTHYATDFWQTWNLIVPMKWTAFQFEIINYVDRYKRKNGIEDLKKARHWLDKLIEIEEAQAQSISNVFEGDSFASKLIIEDKIFDVDTKTGKILASEDLPNVGELKIQKYPDGLIKERPLPKQYNED